MVYDGKYYKSIKAFCAEKGVNYLTLNYYRNSDMTFEEAVEKAIECKKLKSEGRYVINGEKFKTVSEIARRYGLSPTCVNYRLKHGIPMTESRIKSGKHGEEMRIGDYVFASSHEAGKHFGISHITCKRACQKFSDLQERYEYCLDWMCKKYRTPRNIDPV